MFDKNQAQVASNYQYEIKAPLDDKCWK